MKSILPIAIFAVLILVVYFFWKKRNEEEQTSKSNDTSWWSPETGGVNPEWMSPIEEYEDMIASDTVNNFNWTVV